MRRVAWSQDALTDFDAALAYISARDPAAADRLANAIDKAVRLLATRPIGRPGRIAGMFEKLVTRFPYVIAYSLDPGPDGTETLHILRVIHTARNWPTGEWPEP